MNRYKDIFIDDEEIVVTSTNNYPSQNPFSKNSSKIVETNNYNYKSNTPSVSKNNLNMTIKKKDSNTPISNTNSNLAKTRK